MYKRRPGSCEEGPIHSEDLGKAVISIINKIRKLLNDNDKKDEKQEDCVDGYNHDKKK